MNLNKNHPSKQDEDPRFHSSFQHHELAKNFLHISIVLSPSCRSCFVEYDFQRKPTLKVKEGEEPETKKMKVSFDSSLLKDQTMTDGDCLTIEEIKTIIQKAIPPQVGLTTQIKQKQECPQLHEDYLSSPIGQVVHEYHSKDGSQYVLSLACGSSTETQTYHTSIQNIAMWFIETADAVDVSSTEDGGFWKVLYLFQKHTLPLTSLNDNSDDKNKEQDSSSHSHQYSLVGYTTLFHFHAPFKKPKGGIVMRICQYLILPPYQQSGHGKEMMQCVYQIAKSSSDTKENIVEVNVEDPAPGMIHLRDVLDYQMLQSSQNWERLIPTQLGKEDVFTVLSEQNVMKIASEFKITMLQVQRAYEMVKLYQLLSPSFSDHDKKPSPIAEKQYRIMVKKRLLKTCKEEIGACGDKERQKEKLGQLFDELYLHYNRIVKKRNACKEK